MSTELLNLAQRREALEKGLQQYLQGNMLQGALLHWEQQYSMKPSFVLNRFLNDICTTEELRFYRKDMLKQVLYELSTLEKQALLRIEKPKENSQVEALVADSISDAFLAFTEAVLQNTKPVDVNDFNQEVIEQIEQMGLAVAANAQINTASFVEFLPLTSYAKVLTYIYEVFCEFYGPMRADQVYAQTKLKIKANFPEVDLHQLL
ncbi:hypothetical protein F7P75_10725 [Acinetobacter gandensis]|uniref:Uncharacterized protein n=1 Tax=Acinetobacter gandensis TaxID=1443941 RepID=A0A1A7R570_9GAMM|nr:hypothetical protein [Acinetobacter gandensis]KAB0625372.1 hypothetical protein F7P75_10725 [Acinetobacter gandensis]OBX27405.1 hypothetical protein A9J31_10890 [Acinetobacter gandensis]